MLSKILPFVQLHFQLQRRQLEEVTADDSHPFSNATGRLSRREVFFRSEQKNWLTVVTAYWHFRWSPQEANCIIC